MKKDKKLPSVPDRHLDVPSEANRDKHINFAARESGDPDPSAAPNENKLMKRAEKGEKRRKS